MCKFAKNQIESNHQLKMKKNYTFTDLCAEVLSMEATPMSPDEIWQKAKETGLEQKIGSTGKTPSATIGARLYVDIRDNGENSRFVQVSKRPARFMLKTPDLKISEINTAVVKQDVAAAKVVSSYNERDLHPLLVKYVYQSPHFKGRVKTIYHENSVKKAKGVNEWLHPDLVGVYFPFGDYTKETTELQKQLNVNAIKLYSFEMKKTLNFSNLRECYFQAVSNSSWANEGYLVALKIDEDPDFRNEIQRLSNAFGIGIIKLNAEDINESEIVCTARYNETIDWDTLDRLAEDSPDFKAFISDIQDDLTVGKVRGGYDKVIKDDDYDDYIAAKKIG